MVPAERPPLQRDAVIDAARSIIEADGLDGLSLRRLAAALGVTAPALYAHVAGKDDLVRAVAEGELGEIIRRFDELAPSDPLDRLRAHARLYVEYAREHPELFAILFRFPPELEPAALPTEPLPEATSAFAAGAEAVSDAIDAGLIVADDPMLVSFALWSGAHGVATILQLGLGLPRHLEDALIDEVTNRLIDGYRTPSATPIP